MIDKQKRIKELFDKIELYLNGNLVTHVTQRYFKELKELVLEDDKNSERIRNTRV